MFQVCDLSRIRKRLKQELQEKEEDLQEVKEGLRVTLEEMTNLKVLLQVQHLVLDPNLIWL